MAAILPDAIAAPITLAFGSHSSAPRASAEVAAAADQPFQHRRVIDQARGDEVHHRLLALALALPLAVHREQRRAEQGRALRLGDPGPDDDVDGAGLVLEGDEDRALSLI